ncbi:MAG: aminoacyl-tRNA hydrolase [Planctomycetota bacterium]
MRPLTVVGPDCAVRSTPVKMIVGLGNPGPRYARTRHNLGFQVIDVLRERLVGLVDGSQPGSELWEARRKREHLLLLRPGLFMNRSGRPVAQVAVKHGLEAERVLVVYDDLDLPVGKLRLRAGGGSGGHRGIQDICECFQPGVHRLRVGIGRPPGRTPVEEYVLQDFTAAEEGEVAVAREVAADAALSWFDDGLVRAMDRYNGRGSEPVDPATD